MDVHFIKDADFTLPQFYGIDQLVVLMVYPGRIHAFWELERQNFYARSGEEQDRDQPWQLVMRLGPSEGEGFDRLVPQLTSTTSQMQGSIYLEVPSGSRVRLEWGSWNKNDFEPLLISNTLLVPDEENRVPLLVRENGGSFGPQYPKYVYINV